MKACCSNLEEETRIKKQARETILLCSKSRTKGKQHNADLSNIQHFCVPKLYQMHDCLMPIFPPIFPRKDPIKKKRKVSRGKYQNPQSHLNTEEKYVCTCNKLPDAQEVHTIAGCTSCRARSHQRRTYLLRRSKLTKGLLPSSLQTSSLISLEAATFRVFRGLFYWLADKITRTSNVAFEAQRSLLFGLMVTSVSVLLLCSGYQFKRNEAQRMSTTPPLNRSTEQTKSLYVGQNIGTPPGSLTRCESCLSWKEQWRHYSGFLVEVKRPTVLFLHMLAKRWRL